MFLTIAIHEGSKFFKPDTPKYSITRSDKIFPEAEGEVKTPGTTPTERKAAALIAAIDIANSMLKRFPASTTSGWTALTDDEAIFTAAYKTDKKKTSAAWMMELERAIDETPANMVGLVRLCDAENMKRSATWARLNEEVTRADRERKKAGGEKK